VSICVKTSDVIAYFGANSRKAPADHDFFPSPCTPAHPHSCSRWRVEAVSRVPSAIEPHRAPNKIFPISLNKRLLPAVIRIEPAIECAVRVQAAKTVARLAVQCSKDAREQDFSISLQYR